HRRAGRWRISALRVRMVRGSSSMPVILCPSTSSPTVCRCPLLRRMRISNSSGRNRCRLRNQSEMKPFSCDVCGCVVYFENTKCLNCGAALAYLPDARMIASVRSSETDIWQSGAGREYRSCLNYRKHDVCNWAVPADDTNLYCVSCRLNRIIPDLSVVGN